MAFQFEDDAYSANRGYARWQMVLRDVKKGPHGRRCKSLSTCGATVLVFITILAGQAGLYSELVIAKYVIDRAEPMRDGRIEEEADE